MAELASEPFVLVAPEGHPLPERELEISDLRDEAFVDFPQGWGSRALADQAFREAGLQREIAVEVADIMTCVELVRAGFGVAIVPRSLARWRGLKTRLVSGLPWWGVSLVAPSDRPLTAAATAFADLVCTTFDVALADVQQMS